MKALILGATGFIGGQIALAALAAGWEVRGLRRRPEAHGVLQGANVEWALGDLQAPDTLLAAMRGVQVVFHAAGYYPTRTDPRPIPQQIAYARQETDNVLDAARQAGVARLVYTSTLTTIGHPPPGANRLADERDVYQPGTLPDSGYYEVKIAMENRVLEAASNGLPAIVLNPTAVFGPGDVHLTLGGLLITVAKGWMIGWLPGETNAVDVRDVAAAHIAAAERGRVGERYILGGHNLPVRAALTTAARVAGVKPPWFEIPLWGAEGLAKLGTLLPALPLPANHLRTVRHWQRVNAQKAQQELGLAPRPFEDTVRDALDWFRAEGML